jgi:hypothetical protein
MTYLKAVVSGEPGLRSFLSYCINFGQQVCLATVFVSSDFAPVPELPLKFMTNHD